MSRHQAFWDDFYAASGTSGAPGEPSLFARWCAARLDPGSRVVDVGCGNARDSVWLASQGFDVTALDYSRAAVDLARARAEAAGVDVRVGQLDLYDTEKLRAAADELVATASPMSVYGRFLLHALEPEGQRGLYRLAARLLEAGGQLLVEFRTGRDRGARHEFGEHFRSYPDPDEVVAELTREGATLVERVEGYQLAPYRSEDPHVARLAARWA